MLLLAGSGVVVAWFLYLQRPDIPETIRKRFALLHTVLMHKYYADTLVEKIIPRGSTGIGQLLWRVGDIALIDGAAVNGSAKIVGWSAMMIRHIQTGYLYTYAFAMIIGLSAMIGWLLWA